MNRILIFLTLAALALAAPESLDEPEQKHQVVEPEQVSSDQDEVKRKYSLPSTFHTESFANWTYELEHSVLNSEKNTLKICGIHCI